MNTKFERFEEVLEQYRIEHPTQRRGQSVMNALRDFDNKIYKLLWYSDLDCFYQESIVENTLSYLRREWRCEKNEFKR